MTEEEIAQAAIER